MISVLTLLGAVIGGIASSLLPSRYTSQILVLVLLSIVIILARVHGIFLPVLRTQSKKGAIAMCIIGLALGGVVIFLERR